MTLIELLPWCDTCPPTVVHTLQTHTRHPITPVVVMFSCCCRELLRAQQKNLLNTRCSNESSYCAVIVTRRKKDVAKNERSGSGHIFFIVNHAFEAIIMSLTSSRSSTLNARGIQSLIYPFTNHFVGGVCTSCSGLKRAPHAPGIRRNVRYCWTHSQQVPYVNITTVFFFFSLSCAAVETERFQELHVHVSSWGDKQTPPGRTLSLVMSQLQSELRFTEHQFNQEAKGCKQRAKYVVLENLRLFKGVIINNWCCYIELMKNKDLKWSSCVCLMEMTLKNYHNRTKSLIQVDRWAWLPLNGQLSSNVGRAKRIWEWNSDVRDKPHVCDVCVSV